MNQNIRIALLFLLIASLSNLRLSAQTAAEVPVALEFITLSLDRSNIKGLKYESEQVEAIDIYSRGFSRSKKYRGPAQLLFFREQVNPVDGSVTRVAVGHADLPTDAREVLLVFTRIIDAPQESYRIFPIKRDLEMFPPGSYQIFNLSDFTVAGKIEEERFKLEQKDAAIIQIPLQESATIEVKFARTTGEEWTLAYNSLWPHKVGNRTNIFIFNTEDSLNPLEIRVYKEIVFADR